MIYRLIGFAFIIFLNNAAIACSCPEATPVQQFNESRLALVVTIVKKSGATLRNPHAGNFLYVGEVQRVLKGSSISKITFEVASNNGANCGNDFVEGQSYILLGRSDTDLHTSNCSWTPKATPENLKLIDFKP